MRVIGLKRGARWWRRSDGQAFEIDAVGFNWIKIGGETFTVKEFKEQFRETAI